MILPLLKRNVSFCRKTLLLIFSVISLYTVTIVYMYDPKLSDMLSGYQDLLPGLMSAVGMTGIAASLLEWMQIYLYGFIMELFPMIFAVILGNKLLMNEIDHGGMTSLLSTPNSRRRIILTQAVSAVLLMVLLMLGVTGVGIVSAQLLFPGALDIPRYLLLNASTLLLQTVLLGITFFAACILKETRSYYTLGAGLPLLFFLLQMLSNMGGKLENLKYFTLFTLFPARTIVQGGEGVWPCHLALAVAALLLFGGGVVWFEKRDLAL